jgi:DNA-directed RNA polymerase subunit alpha
VGRLTNFDKLSLQVWTDGTQKPSAAVLKAAKLLASYLNQIIDPVEDIEEEQDIEGETMNNEVYNLTVEELELPTRIANALRKAGLGTVKKLVEAPRAKILKVKNLGGKSITIIEEALRNKGVELSEE